jgi:hypothetical protein
MTKLIVVAPPQEPHWTLLGDAHLCQAAWYVRYPLYRHVYQIVTDAIWYDLIRGGGEPTVDVSHGAAFTILDWQHISTGAPDSNVHITVKQFFDVIQELQPQEVVIPDVFQDAHGTLISALNFLDACGPQLYSLRNQDRDPRFMFIPQGLSLQEWENCLIAGIREFGDMFQVVGIPKVLESYSPQARLRAIQLVPEQYKVHMLGVWGGANEMFYGERIRSWDTSLPVAAAQFKHKIEPFDTLVPFLGNFKDKSQLLIGAELAWPPSVMANVDYLSMRLSQQFVTNSRIDWNK